MTPTCTPAIPKNATPQVAGADMSDAEREAHIKDCDSLMVAAMAAGNREEAMNWQQAMYQAIASRSDAQKARMEADIERRISEGNCYFMAVGAEHAAELARHG